MSAVEPITISEGSMELILSTPQEAEVLPSAVERIKYRAESWVEEGVHQGMVLLAARKGKIFLHEAYGRQKPGKDGPDMPLDAIFPLASLTKPITVTAAMILVEDGLLGLNRPVQEYIPEFVGENKERVFVHHLMTHTSGIPDDEEVWTIIEEREASGVDIPPQEETEHTEIHQIVHYGLDIPLATFPGEIMVYSSYGIQLLGEIIRRLSGKSLEDYAQAKLFKPLGMEGTTYSVPESLRSRVVIRPKHAPYPHFNEPEAQERPSPSGGAFSTAMDMAVFGQLFLNEGRYGNVRVLSPMAVKAMTRNQVPGISARIFDEIFPEAGWGLGWSINLAHKGMAYGEPLVPSTAYLHGGAGGVHLWMDPVNEIVGVYFSIVMANKEGDQSNAPIWNSDLYMNLVTATVT
jgi:CubicO group peptidase (beta-lactamase class C family)